MKREFSFESFYVHEGNEVAYLAAQKVIEFPGELFNPFYVYGSTGFGKTHLLKAIYLELSKKFDTLFFTAKEFEKYIEENKVINKPIIVDDLSSISINIQQRLWEVVDICLSNNLQICFSGNTAPRDIKNLDAKLISRLEGGLVCDIQPPKEIILVDMIKKKSEEVGIILSDDVVLELAHVADGSLRAMEGMINRLRAYASLGNLSLDVHNVRLVLKEFYPKGIYSPVSSLLKELQKNAACVLQDVSNKLNTREEYKDKIYIWEMKGYDTSSLKNALDGNIAELKKQYDKFIEQIEELAELQKEFGQLDLSKYPEEAMRIESMLFSPRHVEDVRRFVSKIKRDIETNERPHKFGSFIIGESNQNVYNVYSKQILKGMGEKFNPFIVMGKMGMGKTLFLKSVRDDLKNHNKTVIFIDLEKKKDVPQVDDVSNFDVLIIDNFHNIFSAPKNERKHIFKIIINHIKNDKEVIIGTDIFPANLLLSEEEKIIFELSLEVELTEPSSDLVKNHIKSKLGPINAQALIKKGLPRFMSFKEIDNYINTYSKVERARFIPLGFSGEEFSDLQNTKGVENIRAIPDEGANSQSEGQLISTPEEKYILPEFQDELIEENY